MKITAGGNRALSYTLVAVQFACLIAIALTGPWIARGVVPFIIEAVGFALGGWALWTMRRERFNIVPDPHHEGRLVHFGPYRWIRHPMYASLLLITLGLVLDAPSALRWALWAVLLVDLLVKLNYEERMLHAVHPEYEPYAERSKRLLPFIY